VAALNTCIHMVFLWACEQPTCFIFASKLVMGHVELDDCPALQEPQYTAQLTQLVDMLAVDMPTIGRRE
jgi:ArsR family metal-binding transcriptional regulator